MKRKLICAIILFFLISSCEENKPTYVIGVSQCSDDEWRDKMNDELILEAMFHDGVKVEILSAIDNNEKQIKDIQYFIEKKIDLLIVSPNESAPVTPIVEKAFDAGIPVIVTDRKVLSNKFTAYIGPDNYDIGKLAGEYVVKQLEGKGNVVEIMGTSGSTPAIERHQGFMTIVKKYPDISIVYQEDAVFLKSLGKKKMEEALVQEDTIDLVFAHNDRMAAGAYLAAKEANRENDMFFVGIDAIPHFGIDQVIDGTLDVTFLNPTGGDKIIQLAMDILKGNRYSLETALPTNIVDKRNARVLKLQSDYLDQQKGKIKYLSKQIDGYFVRFTNQRIMLYSSLILLLLVIILFFLTLKSNKSIKYLNARLSKQNAETVSQKRQLERQRDRLVVLSKQLEEATHAKLMFFTNISHDFLTPLTLVIEPIKQLLDIDSLDRKQRALLKIIEKNVNLLIRLVRQILDFRKHEDGRLELILSKNSLSKCLSEWNESFLPTLLKNNIKFNFNVIPQPDDYQIALDYEKIQRVYFNLLSNALKFTYENGRIDVSLSTLIANGRRYAVLKLSDTGIGVSVEHIQNIFNEFYKVNEHFAGSGIGLALARSFVDLHGGSIEVCSSPNGGTTFTVKLPYADFGPEKAIVEDINPINKYSTSVDLEHYEKEINQEPEHYTGPALDNKKELVLVIDDNPNMQEFLSLLLEEQYNLIYAMDGKEGINKAIKYIPDIILCDVMMPVMNGFDCCHWLKSEILTCHIPIMVLTVNSYDEQRIEGYRSGADAYISKPFNSQVLITQIQNLIKSRKQLKELFSDKSTSKNGDITALDIGFMEKVTAIIDQNISDSNFNIELLGKMIGLSRVQLYRKIKSLTNYSPNEIIRIYRLKKAKTYLASSELTISEIAYKVGFSSPSYFTKCYKNYFKENPTFFLKRIENGK